MVIVDDIAKARNFTPTQLSHWLHNKSSILLVRRLVVAPNENGPRHYVLRVYKLSVGRKDDVGEYVAYNRDGYIG